MKLRHASWHACGAAQPICSGQWRWGAQPLVSAEWRPPWLHSYCNVACLKMKGKATELHLSRGVVQSALLAPGGGGTRLAGGAVTAHPLFCSPMRIKLVSAGMQCWKSRMQDQAPGHGQATASAAAGQPADALRHTQDFLVLHKGLSFAQAQSTADDTIQAAIHWRKNC